MDEQREVFLTQWKEKFPGVPTPNTTFSGTDEIEESLGLCKNAIKGLEDRLSQEKFHLIFLQTHLAAKKKSYSRERWGYNRAGSSSFESDKEPATEIDENAIFLAAGNENDHLEPDGDAVPPSNKPVVLLRENNDERGQSSNRVSKVLENVKLFESRADSKEGGGGENATNSGLVPRSSVRKRTAYLEVWECKTGADKDEKTAEVIEQTDENLEAAIAMATGLKSQPSQRREDYVEVWRCNTGDQVSVGVVYDDQDEFAQHHLKPLQEEVDGNEDYDITDIDMKDGYGKRHYTMAGSDVKLLRNESRSDPSRLTWPASARAQDGDADENSDNLDDNGDAYSGLDLSDLDDDDSHHFSDSPQSGSSRHDSVDSAPEPTATSNGKASNHLEISPLHKLRRARTTNERMSVAFSAFQTTEWSDEDHIDSSGPDRSSLISVQSTDVQSSDEDGHMTNDTSLSSYPATAPIKSDSPTPIFVFSRPKSVHSDDSLMTDAGKPVISMVEGQVPEYGSPKSDAVSDMVDYQKVRSIAEAEKLRMRRWVLSSLLETEQAYLQYLNTLLLYMKPLKATIGTSQPVMSAQDFDTLFYRVPELHNLHGSFYDKLKPKLDDWSADTSVGDLFRRLLSKLSLYADYLNNYKRAQHTVEKCAKENAQFAQIIESLKVQSRGSKDAESISLIEVLYKPVERVMRTTLVLQDILKHTPHRHPDYQILRQVLKQSQQFLGRINSTSSSSFKPRRVPSSAAAAARSADRELIKEGFLVEVASDGSRKLRHCFLFSDLLLCAKQKNAAGMFHSKDSYECKWYIPLADLSFQPREDSEAVPDVPPTSEDELRTLSNKAQQLKRDISREHKRHTKEQGKASESSPAKSRREERLRKKLAEIEARIVLAAPDLALRIYHMQGKEERRKCYMFLMSSDYERIEWTEAIMKQQESCFKSFSLTSFEVNLLLATCVRQRKMNTAGSMFMKEEEDLLSGYLNVTIHSGQGFLRACNPYCTLEVDSYGQFQTKAKTRPCHDTKDPVWDEEFEIDVDGAMTLRILCYDRAREASAGASYDDDVLIAKGKVGLIQESLRDKGEWKEESVLMNELAIRVSVKFTPREHSLQRLPSKKQNGAFGVKIETVAKRDSSGIPSIVRKCVAEVERRGMNEVGIYRVSGVASEIQALKASFDTNRKDVAVLLNEVDVNAVAGVLKLYFRELPEPLFTDARYGDFVEASSLTDPDTKQRTISRLLADLPAPNYKTLHFLRKHLIKVANNESMNKMSPHNLATVFGPTLLRPAEDKSLSGKTSTTQSALALNALRLDVHYQMDVLLYCLELDEMLDYDSMKSNNSSPEKSLSRSFENLSTKTSDAGAEKAPTFSRSVTDGNLGGGGKPVIIPKNDVSSNTLVPPPPSSQPRYHPYEEIFIPPRTQQPPKPPVSRKPSVETRPKPKPAPRRSQAPKQTIVTDL
ncbi:active breakpoint cluster region-related protein-like isoform X1 [Clavelina lepadiformis]|uniref:active breakpoint cluster region-related protein-like isoform X1 n=1 Tax=Clavelina lepadiformis TaxID=159417 RepID=UPI0040420BC9